MTKEEISIQITALGIRERIVYLLREESRSNFSVSGSVSLRGNKIYIGSYPFAVVGKKQIKFFRATTESCAEFKQVKAEIDKFLDKYYSNVTRRYEDGNVI